MWKKKGILFSLGMLLLSVIVLWVSGNNLFSQNGLVNAKKENFDDSSVLGNVRNLYYGLTDQLTAPNVFYKGSDGIKISHLFQYGSGATTSSFAITQSQYEVYRPQDLKFKLDLVEHQEGENSVLKYLSEELAVGTETYVTLSPNERKNAVKHEYSVKNISNEKMTIYPVKQVDTMLGSNDAVPIYSRGENRGLYIESSGFRLDYIFDVPNGPVMYDGKLYREPFYNVFGPVNKQQNTTNEKPEDSIVLENADTGIFMSWGEVELDPGETFNARYDVGIKSDQDMKLDKSAINKKGSIENTVGDKIEYTVEGSVLKEYQYIKITDVLPEELEKPTEIHLKTGDGLEVDLNIDDVYDADTHTLTVEIPEEISKDNNIDLVYTTEINASGSGKTLLNVATITGKSEINDSETVAEHKLVVEERIPDPFLAPVVYGDDMDPTPNLEDEFVDFRVDLEVPLRDASMGFPQKFILQNNFPVHVLKLNIKEPVKITNEKGVDVSNKFETILNEGKLETSISNPADAGLDIYGHTLSIKYQFVAKSDIDLMPYLKDGFYRFNLDATFQYSEAEEPLQSNVGEGTLPGPVSTATAYYRDEAGSEIQGFPPVIQKGKVEMDTFEFKQLDIDNYEFVKSEGPLSGLFKIDPIETIFTYKENKLTLIQSVERLDGGIGTEAMIGEVLQYGLNVKTSFAAETPEVFYKAFTLTEPLDSQLEAPTEMILKTKAGSSVGSIVYDSDNHRLVATLDEKDQVPRSEELQLEYKAKVKNDTQIGTEIKAKATVEGSYSNGSQAKSQESNEVTTTITDGILEFISAPNKLSFGDDLKLAPTNKLYPLKDFDSALTVKDNRVSGEWSMVARVLKPMTGQSGRVLNGSLRYYKGSIDNEMTEESLSVYATHSQASEVLVSDSWKERIEGPMLNVRAGQATEETYSGTIEWELQDVPGNDKFLGDL